MEKWLNIGCGNQLLDGFINVDIDGPAQVTTDIRKGLPFEDNSISGIFSEHFIEHLTRQEGIQFFCECFRVLKPGGVIRSATPDLQQIVKQYQDDTWNQASWLKQFGYEWLPNKCTSLNTSLRSWEHKHIYDYEDLVMVAHLSGFHIIQQCEIGKSNYPKLSNLEYRDDSIVVEFAKADALTSQQLPLVSILIPAYNEPFIQASLASAITQDYPNKEIIVCNDNPDSRIKEVVEFIQTQHPVTYFEHDNNVGAVKNYLQCLSLANGKYIKFLNDDDILLPECVSKMVSYFEAYGKQVSLISSKRMRIDENMQSLPDDPSTQVLVPQDSLIHGLDLGNFVLRHTVNIIGEPTTTMFRKSDIDHIIPNPISLNGRPYGYNVDLAIWLNLLTKGHAIYFSTALSCFRIHAHQEQQQQHHRYPLVTNWHDLIHDSLQLGYLQQPLHKAQALLSEVTLLQSVQHEATSRQIATDLQAKLKQIQHELIEIQKQLHSSDQSQEIPPFQNELAMIHQNPQWLGAFRYHPCNQF